MTEPYSLVIKRSAEKELKAVPQVTSSGSSIAFEAWPNSLGRRDAKTLGRIRTLPDSARRLSHCLRH